MGFCRYLQCQATLHKRKDPAVEDFLLTVLAASCSHVCQQHLKLKYQQIYTWYDSCCKRCTVFIAKLHSPSGSCFLRHWIETDDRNMLNPKIWVFDDQRKKQLLLLRLSHKVFESVTFCLVACEAFSWIGRSTSQIELNFFFRRDMSQLLLINIYFHVIDKSYAKCQNIILPTLCTNCIHHGLFSTLILLR